MNTTKTAYLKHAWLLMAHNNFEQLNILLKQLDFDCNTVFIHVDKKAKKFDPSQLYVPEKAKILLLPKRLDIAWGGSSQIDLELYLLEEALKTSSFDFFHLVSGQDLLIKPFAQFDSFLQEHKNTQFLELTDCSEFILTKRLYVYWPFQNICGRGKTLLTFILRVINTVIAKVQQKLHIYRSKGPYEYWAKGANWFSITQELAEYVVSKKEWVNDTFKYSFCCDELFLQTLVKNSGFKNQVYKKDTPGTFQTLRHIDWERGNPYTFTNTDFDILTKCAPDLFIARKFDQNKDIEIIQRIAGYYS